MAGRRSAKSEVFDAARELVQGSPDDPSLARVRKALNVHDMSRPVAYSLAAAAATAGVIATGGAQAAAAAEVAPASNSADAVQSATTTPAHSAATGTGIPALFATPVLLPEHLAPSPTAEKHTGLEKVRHAAAKSPQVVRDGSRQRVSEEAREDEPEQPAPGPHAANAAPQRHVGSTNLSAIRRSGMSSGTAQTGKGGNVQTVRMEPGTTVWGVAEWVYGPNLAARGVAEIAHASHLQDPGRIAAGHEIQVPLPAGEHAVPGVAEAHRVTLGSNLTELAGRARLVAAEGLHAGNPNLIHTTQDWLKPANPSLAQAYPSPKLGHLVSPRAPQRQAPAARPAAPAHQASPKHRMLVQQHIAALRTHANGAGTFTGPAILTAPDLAGWFHQHFGPGNGQLTQGVTVENLATEYIAQGHAQGIRGDFGFVQACLETGGFTNRDTVLNNFAGIAHPQSAPSGTDFATPQTGVAAQIQLLKKVAVGNDAPMAGPKVAPNWGGRNTNQVDGLAGNWASDPSYAQSLNNLWHAAIIWSLQHPDAGIPQDPPPPPPPPSPAAHHSRLATLWEAGQRAGYINPFGKGGWDWKSEPSTSKGRLDQGFDPYPTRDTPVLAIGDGVVVESGQPGSPTGWPGPNGSTIGGFVAYRMTAGPLKDAIVYVAENISDLPPVGTVVKPGDQIGVAHPGYPNTEWGFASGKGTSAAVPGHPNDPSVPRQISAATSGGKAFVRFLEKGLNVPGLPDLGSGPVAPPGVTPSLPTVPVAPAPSPPTTPDAGPAATTPAPDPGSTATAPATTPAPDPSPSATTPATPSAPDPSPAATTPTTPSAPDPSPSATTPTTIPAPDPSPSATTPATTRAADPSPAAPTPTTTSAPDSGPVAMPPTIIPAPDSGSTVTPPTTIQAPDPGPVATPPTTIPPPDPSPVETAPTRDSNPAAPSDVGRQGTLRGPASRVKGPASALVQSDQSPQGSTPSPQGQATGTPNHHNGLGG